MKGIIVFTHAQTFSILLWALYFQLLKSLRPSPGVLEILSHYSSLAQVLLSLSHLIIPFIQSRLPERLPHKLCLVKPLTCP